MQNLSNKVNGDVLPPEEWNQVPQEIQNVITSSGQTLSNGDLSQLVKAIARYAASGDFYETAGTANDIELSPIADVQAPIAYYEGMVCRFIATASTNNATVTINVNGLGSRNIVTEDGGSMATDGIQANRITEIVYSASANNFKFLRYQYASESLAGVTRYASNAEAIAGTAIDRAVTPASLQAKINALTGASAVKTGDTASFSNTPSADPHLDNQLAIPGFSRFVIEGYFVVEQTVAGVTFQWNNDQAGYGTLESALGDSKVVVMSGVGGNATISFTSAELGASATTVVKMTLTMLEAGISPGNFRFRWGEETTDVSGTELKEGSFLRLYVLE
jgi:hypothetical protein